MNKRHPQETYQQKAEQYKQLVSKISRKDNRYSWSRITLFVLFIIAVVFFANEQNGDALLLSLLLFIIVFPLLIKYHNQVKKKKFHLESLVGINEEELSRLSGKLRELESGDSYDEAQHPYTGDLDVFGEHSLFQLINRCNTSKGKAMLAQWLKNPAAKNEVESRQSSVKEIEPQLAWRQSFQAHGRVAQEKEEDTDALLRWVKENPALAKRNLYKAALLIMPLFTLAGIISYFFFDGSSLWPLLAIAVNMLILWSTAEKANTTHKKTFKSISALQAYRTMIAHVEASKFEYERLQKLQSHFQHGGVSASKEISRLEHILDNFNARGNLFYHIINVVILLDVYWLLRADKWKSELKGDVGHWFDSISELEGLNSMAGFAYSHPDYSYPEITEEAYVFEAQNMGHCLIKAEKRINNDFSMQDKGRVCIITGSNMSGKSTFLRTVGVNVVLALMGAPVCADRLKTSVIQVFTSMRTQDSLEESVSSFYAELKRLRQLLQMLEAPQLPVMYMLDEILKGTNSQDRHNGAASLIRQLSKLPSFGFVSTHDLELGRMENELDKVINYSFTSSIEDDEIYFDYKIHEGICKSFNASKLMAKMGIAVEE
ncbi:MAG: MutS-related protein [Cyclobacteriaceae bacterium]